MEIASRPDTAWSGLAATRGADTHRRTHSGCPSVQMHLKGTGVAATTTDDQLDFLSRSHRNQALGAAPAAAARPTAVAVSATSTTDGKRFDFKNARRHHKGVVPRGQELLVSDGNHRAIVLAGVIVDFIAVVTCLARLQDAIAATRFGDLFLTTRIRGTYGNTTRYFRVALVIIGRVGHRTG